MSLKFERGVSLFFKIFFTKCIAQTQRKKLYTPYRGSFMKKDNYKSVPNIFLWLNTWKVKHSDSWTIFNGSIEDDRNEIDLFTGSNSVIY